MKKELKLLCFSIVFLLFSLAFPVFALFDTGTALLKGQFEIDVSVNPLPSIKYGQSFAFLHYGLGSGYEVNGYFSKWGAIFDGQNSNYKAFTGVLKQWADYEYLDLATEIGLRKVLTNSTFSLIGPGILYTLKIQPSFRIAGHLQYIGAISPDGITAYNRGYTAEIGGYYKFNPGFEFALGVFMNSTGDIRPIYTLNFYL
jgi:hypothetical protein